MEMELSKAQEIAETELAPGLLSWHALNHELSSMKSDEITRILDNIGADFISIGDAHVGMDKTCKMYDARAAVQDYVCTLEGDPIICWLDSDLEFSALVADGDDLQINQPWPWIHMVWHQWLTGEEVDIGVGDVTGDPPIPASSTILTNLLDLAQIGEVINGSRWSIRDPAYDLSEVAKPNVLFPPCAGVWSNEFDVVESLLWKGTLNRPLVASEEILCRPHRPWFVRGGLTIVFNREAMRTPTPRFKSMGITARRGDSFWLVRNVHNDGFTVGHFPFPLLHRRGQLDTDHVDLVQLFHSRFFSDLFGAATLKAAICALEPDSGAFEDHIRSAIESRAIRSQQVFESALTRLEDVNGAISRSESAMIENTLLSTLDELNQIDLVEVACELSSQITDFLEVSVDG